MKFIHFGCWNNGTCSLDGTNGLSLTMRKLNSYLLENSIDFITVAGDNYYPPKTSKGKAFIKDNFTSGFDCLPKSIKKYLLFGNHDIEDMIVDDMDKEIKCKLLDEQLKITEGDNNTEIFNDVIYKIIDKTIIIMLDTNLYDREIIDTPINKTCYSKLFNKLVNKMELTIGDLIGYQNCFIIDILKSYQDVKNIIFIGHHPIYSIKNKKGEKDEYKLFRFVDFLKKIQDLLIDKNIYYLCADTHMYQKGTINISSKLKIEQYIVGTGGAEQDKIYHEDNKIKEDDLTVYKKSSEKKEFGFLVVDIKDSDVKYEFISAENTMTGGHKKYKYKKYKIIRKIKYNK